MSIPHSNYTHYKNVVVPTAETKGLVLVVASGQLIEKLKLVEQLVRHTEMYYVTLVAW
jgi:hypothetical protein